MEAYDDNQKIAFTEDVYKAICDNALTALTLDKNDDMISSFKIYGELINKRDVLFCDKEAIVYALKNYLFIVNSNDMDKITEQAAMGRYFLGNVIFHIMGEDDYDEKSNFRKQYLKKFNFYISNFSTFPILVLIDPKTEKINIEMYVGLDNGRFYKKKSAMIIQTEDGKEIPINKYDEYLNAKNGTITKKNI